MDIFQRTELLFGTDFIEEAATTRAIVFGLGGVGSWCAEMLIRSGIGHLTLVDADVVAETNINRQLPATSATIGRSKVEVMAERLKLINPQAELVPLQRIYTEKTHESFQLGTFDYIIDAIDSLEHKVHLIQQACTTEAILFASMGAALKTDPLKMRVAEFNKVTGCPLAAAVRRRLKVKGGVDKKFLCVYSEEQFKNRGKGHAEKVGETDVQSTETNPYSEHKRINGTSSYMPALFGMTIASLVIRDILKKSEELIEHLESGKLQQ
jgi:tRNA A37 threonylcarbamoyladenosine dehydratase